jgi:hypothetical protein
LLPEAAQRRFSSSLTGAVRLVKPPTRLSQPSLAETLFFLVADYREGVSRLLTRISMSWLIVVVFQAGQER